MVDNQVPDKSRIVIPAKAGTQCPCPRTPLDPRFRGDDGNRRSVKPALSVLVQAYITPTQLKEYSMLHSSAPFFATLLAVVFSTLLLVMTAAFLLIPYAIGAHPGEVRIPVAPITAYHLT